MITWNVNGEQVESPAAISGVPLGDHIGDKQFGISWNVPPSPEHPDWPVRISRVAYVVCESGVSGLDKYMSIKDIDIVGMSVLFRGSLFSYSRTIKLKAAIGAEMLCPQNGIWYALQPFDSFTCRDIELVVKPGPELPNPPWSEPVGIVVEDSWEQAGVTVESGDTITLVFGKAQWYKALAAGTVRDVTINRVTPWHPHATEDLLPTISWRMLDDNTGVVLTVKNLRPYERYVIEVDTGDTHIIYARTDG